MALQVVALGVALTIAELFYKFHSFLLESIAFLVTWFIVDFLIQALAAFLKRNQGSLSDAGSSGG
jgi:hypothetical protein